jgi:endonuclease YncB( thermonuclease family)
MPLLLAAKIIAAGATFACTPIAVWDGDGPVWCAEGPRIRLHGIAAREVRHTRAGIVDAGCKTVTHARRYRA